MSDVILSVIFWVSGALMGYAIGVDAGMIAVASGQSQCQLIETTDKTTNWKCSEVGE